MSDRRRLYLSCIRDWKAPYEVALMLGDDPPLAARGVQLVLAKLVKARLAERHAGNNTFRLTDAGWDELGEEPPTFEVTVWDTANGDVVRKEWRATESEVDAIESEYDDEPFRDVVVERNC